MSALVGTPLRCGKVLLHALCMEPAVVGVIAVMPCGHNPLAYACESHRAPAQPAGDHWTCRLCGALGGLVYEVRSINEGDLPDELDQQIVGRWPDGSVCLP